LSGQNRIFQYLGYDNVHYFEPATDAVAAGIGSSTVP
jgi:hypothetical protein